MLSTPRRGNNIDCLRLVLAVMVIFSHSYALGLGSEEHEPITVLTRGQRSAGAVAVDGFFILSGYLITQSWQRSRGFWSYLKKRAARIYPAFIVAMALCVFVVAPLAHPQGWSVVNLGLLARYVCNTANLGGTDVPGIFATNPLHAVNGSVWSIRFEFWCYLGLAGLGICGQLRRPKAMLWLFAAFILISFLFSVTHWNPGFKIVGKIFGWPLQWARLLPLFTSGIVFSIWEHRIPLNWKFAGVALAVLGLGAATPHGLTVALPTAGAYLMFWLGLGPMLRCHNFGKYGDYSYGTYLYAFPIQQLLIHWNGGHMNPYLLFVVSTAAAVLAGAVSWYVVERHFLKPWRLAASSVNISEISPAGEPLGAGKRAVMAQPMGVE